MMKWILSIVFLLGITSLGDAATRYVAKTGNDSNTCIQALDPLTPKLTIAGGLTCTVAGDTLIVKAGAYNERINHTQFNNGTNDSNRVIIMGDPGDTPLTTIIRPLTVNSTPAIRLQDRDFITFDNIKVDCTNVRNNCIDDAGGTSTTRANGITFQNGEVHAVNIVEIGSAATGCIVFDNDDGNNTFPNKVINTDIHHCGGTHAIGTHGVYTAAYNTIIEKNRIHDIQGIAIQVWHETGSVNSNTVRYNKVWNIASHGIWIGHSTNTIAHSNEVSFFGQKAPTDTALAGFDTFSVTNLKWFNNTIYGGPGCLRLDGSTNAQVRNNLCIANGTGNILAQVGGTTGTTQSDNHFTDLLTVVMDAPNRDFHIRDSGVISLIDQGFNLSAFFTVDGDGTTLPQGAGFDIGALEFVAASLDNDLVLEISCDNDVLDTSGEDNHGSLQGGVEYRPGKYNQGCFFDGTNDFISVSDATSLDLINGFTISMWVKPTVAPTTWQIGLAKSTNYYLYVSNGGTSGGTPCPAGGVYGGFFDDSPNNLCWGTPVSAEVFTHLALTYDSSTQILRLYVNGTLTTFQMVGGTMLTNASALTIGASGGSFFGGIIDEVRLYNYAQIQSEIAVDMVTSINPVQLSPFLSITAGSGAWKLGAGASSWQTQGALE